MSRDINLQFQVYAVFNQPAGITLYSFSQSLSQVTPTLRQDLGSALLATTEFQRYAADFTLFRWKDIRIMLSNNIMGVSTLTSTPPIFYRVAPYVSGTVTADGVGRSDNAIEYKITNFGSLFESRHPFPSLLVGSSGNIIGGKDTYLPCNLSLTTGMELQIGNITNPDFTSASSVAVKIISIDVVCKVDFASPYVQ